MNDIKINGKVIEIVTIPFKLATGYSIIIALQKLFQGLIPTFQLIAIAKFLDVAIGIFEGIYSKNKIIILLVILIILIAFE